MSITILTYHDQSLIDQVNQNALARAKALEDQKTALQEVSDDFSSALNDASSAYRNPTDVIASHECPPDLYPLFEEAAFTYGVPVNLLTSIARAESGFHTNAVSSAGAVGIMQLMPATAASLGVENSYDPRQNIMGGAKLISQLLSKYNGNTSLALAAYNAGSNNVDQYGGIPPFSETQTYVRKVLSYLGVQEEPDLKNTINNFLSSQNISENTLYALIDLLKSINTDSSNIAPTAEKEVPASISVTVVPNSNTSGM